MHKMWDIKMSADTADTLDMYIYGHVESDYYDWWGDKHESETSAEHFRSELSKYPNAKNINIYINSLGGSVLEGTAIYNQLKRHPAHKTVYVDGFACSIASVIAMAGDKVVMPKNTMMMIHNPWTICMGNAEELRKQADDLDTIAEASRQAYLCKSNGKLDEDKLIEMLNAETYLTAEKCIEYGLADEYAEQDADMEAAKKALEADPEEDAQQADPELEKLRAQVAELEKLREEQQKNEEKSAQVRQQEEMKQRLDKAADCIINYFGMKKEENS